MRQPETGDRTASQPRGVIDSLSSGFGVVNRQLWIIFLPVLLDLFLWLGPQASVSPLVGELLTAAQLEQAVTTGVLAPEQVGSAQETRQRLLQATDELNLLALLAPSLVGVPSLMAVLGGQGELALIESWPLAIGIAAVSSLVGLMLGSVFLTAMAQGVRQAPVSPELVLIRAAFGWVRALGFGVLVMAIALAVALPVAVLMGLAALVSPTLGSLGLAVAVVMLVWLHIYLFFAPHAIFVSGKGPVEAVRVSLRLVHSFFRQTLVLIGVVWLISLGLAQVWGLLASNTGGTLLGIMGNAYIETGLIAGAMVFYWDRAVRQDG